MAPSPLMTAHGPKRVCIITPGTIGSNPRSYKQAQSLHEMGYDVTVIATRLAGMLDLADDVKLPWRMCRVDLRSRALWRIMRSAQTVAGRALSMIGAEQKRAFFATPFALPLLPAACRQEADLYIAHYPPALFAAFAASKLHRAALAYDAEDFHLGDHPDTQEWDSQRNATRNTESRFIGKCRFVTAAAPLIGEALVKAYGIPSPQTVLNCFPLTSGPDLFQPRGEIAPGPSIYWYSQTIGPNRGLEQAVGAIAASRSKPHLYLRGRANEDYCRSLVSLAESLGAGDRLHFLSPVPATELERMATGFDLGLCAEPGLTANNLILLSNKLFGYLLCGVPPLMSDTPGQLRFARENGLEELVYSRGDVSSLSRLIDKVLATPETLARYRRQSWDLGRSRFNWDLEQAKFLRLVAGAIGSADRPPPT